MTRIEAYKKALVEALKRKPWLAEEIVEELAVGPLQIGNVCRSIYRIGRRKVHGALDTVVRA